MFIRETSPDGKISSWTIRPEANRCLTLDQVYKASTTDFLPLSPFSHSSTSYNEGSPETDLIVVVFLFIILYIRLDEKNLGRMTLMLFHGLFKHKTASYFRINP